jgi:hypothetical protein
MFLARQIFLFLFSAGEVLSEPEHFLFFSAGTFLQPGPLSRFTFFLQPAQSSSRPHHYLFFLSLFLSPN